MSRRGSGPRRCPKIFRRGVHRLNDVAEQQAGEGCQLSLGQDQLLSKRRHRSEVTAGQFVEERDTAAVLVAKFGDPLSQRADRSEAAGFDAEHR